MTTTGTTTGTTTSPRAGLSVRVRITATVTILAAVGLTLAGFAVYVIENGRISDRAQANAIQELDEFAHLVNPESREIRPTLRGTLTAFLQRNVPDSDEVLVAFVGDQATLGSGTDSRVLSEDPAFLEAARPLINTGGTVRTDSAVGEIIITSQPVTVGKESGALIVVGQLDEDRAELRETMRSYAIVSALGLLLISGVAFVRASQLLAPLRTLRRTAEEITETDLSRRIPLTGNDDVTSLTATVNGMLDRLESAFGAQRQLLDDVGHELRTPLTVLQGHLELLDTSDPAEVADTRDLLLDETERMSRLVEDLILLAKTERPDFLAPAEFDVASLTTTMLAKASGLGERQWRIDEAADVTLLADEQRITQALLQYAANAVRHTEPDDVIAIGSRMDADHVLFWVRDTGPGVPPEDRDRIFERFGRGADAKIKHADGFGLGLSIVTAIAHAHAGEAWLDDAYTDGARFVMSIPCDPGQTPDPPPTTH